MVTIPPAKRQSHRTKIRPAPAAKPGPVALTLVSASYDKDALTLTMAFDRPIDISGFNGADVIVDDSTYNNAEYFALGDVSLIDAVTVQVGLEHVTGPSGSGVILSAANDTNIVAVDDGGTWAGTSGTGLPFP